MKAGIIFDLDGVLIDSHNVMEIAFKYAFKKYFPEQEPPFDQYKKHLGKGFLMIMDELNLPRRLYQPFYEKSVELLSHIQVIEGIPSLLKILKRNKLYIGIATGKDKNRTWEILKAKGIIQYFDKIICNDEVCHGKPHPESIEFHVEYGDLNKRDVLFIGDSTSDILCARNAGVRSIAALWGMGKRNELLEAVPDYVANNVDGLKDLLKKLGLIKKI